MDSAFARAVDAVTMSAWATLLVGLFVFTVGEIFGVFGHDRL